MQGRHGWVSIYRAADLGVRARARNHGEIPGWRLRCVGETELTSGPGWSVGETAARVTGLSAVRACGVGLLAGCGCWAAQKGREKGTRWAERQRAVCGSG